jgi:hypothetical protein
MQLGAGGDLAWPIGVVRLRVPDAGIFVQRNDDRVELWVDCPDSRDVCLDSPPRR